MSWKSDGKSPPSTHQQSPNSKRIYPATNGITIPNNLTTLQIKSKFDAEFRRFSLPIAANQIPTYAEFRSLVESLHSLQNIPFTLCYTSSAGDLLPITNDENFRKAFESARPTLRLLIQRKGESWEEKYGYGTDTIDRRRKGLSIMLMPSNVKTPKRNYSISNPEDFRQVSAIIDVDIIPEAHRRVRLCKHGSDKPLGFYIRDGTSVRVTQGGVMKVQGIFISRLVEGGLAESTGLLAVNDEVLEVNGIEVSGKTLDQVTDMMVANAQNLIITVKPANQRNTLQRGANSRISGNSDWSEGARSSMYGGIGGGGIGGGGDSDDDKDEVTDLLQQPQPPPRHHHHAPSTRTTHFNKQGFP